MSKEYAALTNDKDAVRKLNKDQEDYSHYIRK